MDQPPTIMPLKFVPARQVLTREDEGFTRWLAEHLEYLEPVLGLTAMELVATESPVGSFFLDIRASGTDAQGQTVAVPIENQYGRTDHDHLGKLVTYTAQAAATAERVLGVWIVEHARDEHLAAVSFLNEISPAKVGWVLAEVRFVPGPGDAYYVQFEPKARPNEVLTAAPRQSGNLAADLARKRYIDAILERVGPAVLKLGYGSIRPYGHSRRIDLPPDLPLADRSEVRLMAGQSYTRLTLVALSPSGSRREGDVILELTRLRYADALAARLPADTEVRWHARIASDVIDFAALTWAKDGYLNSDVERAADWLVACCQAWLDVLRANPLTDAELAAATATVMPAEQDARK
jgi:hypothetical protein